MTRSRILLAAALLVAAPAWAKPKKQPSAPALAPAPSPSLVPPALPQPPPPSAEAETAKAAAVALLETGRYGDALTFIDDAIRLAPTWPEYHLLRGRAQVGIAGPGSELAALSRPVAGRNYKAMSAALAAALASYEEYLKLSTPPGGTVPPELSTTMGGVRARIVAVGQAQKALEQQVADSELARQATELERAERLELEQRHREAEDAKARERAAKDAVEKAAADAQELRKGNAALRMSGIGCFIAGTVAFLGTGIFYGLQSRETAHTVSADAYFYTGTGLAGLGGMMMFAGLPPFIESFTNGQRPMTDSRKAALGRRHIGSALLVSAAALFIGAGVFEVVRQHELFPSGSNGSAFHYTAIAAASVGGALAVAGIPVLVTSFFMEPRVKISIAPNLVNPGATLKLTF